MVLATNYVLIDFENVQPRNVTLLNGHDFKVIVFVGANQTKVSIELAEALQNMGADATYVRASGSGRNALDFHLAYYLGNLAAADPDGFYHIVSKDTGFDPLVRHLKRKRLRVSRVKDIAEIPVLRIASQASKEERLRAVVENLATRGQSRPRKVKTLGNTINALFTEKLPDQELLSIVDEMQRRGYIVVNDTNVSYDLPAPKDNGASNAESRAKGA